MVEKKQKILLIRLGGIGDIVFASIIPYAIKKLHPDYEIHYLAPKGTSEILENNPYIDKALSWDSNKRKSYRYIFSVAHSLAKEKYDVIFNMNNTLRSYLISLLAFPKKLIQKKNYGGHWVEDFYNCAKSVYSDLSIPERLYLSTNPESEKTIKEFLNNYPRPYIVIAPGGDTNKNRAGRIWNIEYWKNLSNKILNNYGGTIFVCGSESELNIHKSLEQNGVVIVSGNYTLQESCALISNADLFISGDTGTLHIASALDVKTLALLGSTSPDKIKPYGVNGHWISSNCECKYCWNKKCKLLQDNETYTPCMEALSPEEVFNKITEIF